MPRFQFLNWRPDLEDTEYEGLTVADNVIHEPEGYQPVHLGSAGSFATTGGLSGTGSSIVSVSAKRVGSTDDLFCAWVHVATSGPSSVSTLHVGVNGVTSSTTATGYPLSNTKIGVTSVITAFDVCEYADKIFFVAAMGNSDGDESMMAGYLDYG